jgi:hypothetical protein
VSIDFLPDEYSQATNTTIVVPVYGRDDLTDPSNGRIVVPARVEISLTLIEDTARGDRTHAYVAVIGPRRLKSGAFGKPITTIGWEKGRNDGPRGYVPRPNWLTLLLADRLPMGWDPKLLDLPHTEVAA